MTINQVVPSDSSSKVKSAAMLGLALSVGASGVLLADGEASATDLSSVAAASTSLPSVPEADSLTTSAKEVTAPVPSVYHTVEQGESLWKIAQRHQVPLHAIESVNGISDQSLLQVGQVIKVPADQTQQASEPRSVVNLAQVTAPESAVTVPTEASQASTSVATVPTVTLTRTLNAPEAGEGSASVASSAEELQSTTVIATVDSSDSLQNAGLTTQADGFQQELIRQDQLASAELPTSEVTGEPDVPLVASLSPTRPHSSYQVQAGDTLESIAGNLGLSAEDLAGANSISNPDFILAGETLALPQQVGGTAPEATSSESSAPVVAAAAAATSETSVGDQRLAYLQSTAERRVNSDALLSRLRGESTPSVEAPLAESSEAAEAVEDPYAASLVGQVRAARPQAEAVPLAEPEATQANSTDERIALASRDIVNAEFANRDASEARELATAPDEALLAAAPLAPDAYIPTPQTNVGQVVSPDMPILPGADNYLPDAPDYFDGYVWPARGTFTSGYGPRWGRMHRGVDIAAPVGTPIVAAAPGVVERSGWNSGGYGNLVDIRHPDGSLTRYAHNSRLLVRPGQRVAQGEQIAEMGSTGYSTGPHLHFEIHASGGGTVNPMAYLPNR